MADETAKVQAVPPKIVKISEELSCELNQVEWQSRSQEMADAQEHFERERQRKKDMTKQLNADVAQAEAQVSKLANVVQTHREFREVTVEIKYDYDLGKVIKTRTDTGEVISEREITDQERQADLDLFNDANDVIEESRAAERKEEETEATDGEPEEQDDDDDEDLSEGDLPSTGDSDEEDGIWDDIEGDDDDTSSKGK